MTYEIWPGVGLSDAPVEWVKVLGAPAETKAKCTANVDRRRNEGNDFSTFRGISKKADALSLRGAPRRMRQTSNTGRRGPAAGTGLQDDSWGGKIRSALASGPMTRAEITAATGIPANRIASYLKNDIKQGRIVRIVREGAFQQLALAGGER
jgi:hypothetical protein